VRQESKRGAHMHVGVVPCFEFAVRKGVCLAVGHGAAASDGDVQHYSHCEHVKCR
jgi:hypothetical protein